MLLLLLSSPSESRSSSSSSSSFAASATNSSSLGSVAEGSLVILSVRAGKQVGSASALERAREESVEGKKSESERATKKGKKKLAKSPTSSLSHSPLFQVTRSSLARCLAFPLPLIASPRELACRDESLIAGHGVAFSRDECDASVVVVVEIGRRRRCRRSDAADASSSPPTSTPLHLHARPAVHDAQGERHDRCPTADSAR